MNKQKFDLNIEKILENWDIYHAIREIIANSIDEQLLTQSKDIEIFNNAGLWHIKDYGRGIRYHHLTQNENIEKLEHPHLIGKFGVGLKDALATFDKHNINVKILSKYGIITFAKSEKYGFEDIVTLHAFIEENPDENFIGTEFILDNCNEHDIQKAKETFIIFQNINLLESTPFGDVYMPNNSVPKIYINGIEVAQEKNFLFSYNITNLNKKIKDSLNRERTNVGRTAYKDRIIDILLKTKNEIIINDLMANLSKYDEGTMKDELNWTNVAEHAVKLLNLNGNCIFATPREIQEVSGNTSDIILNSNKQIVFIPDNIKEKMYSALDNDGNPIQTIQTVMIDYNKNFHYTFVNYSELSPNEKEVYDYLPQILKLVNAKYLKHIIFISETISDDIYGGDTLGIYNPETEEIIIRRDQLSSLTKFSGVLIHEIIHAKEGLDDITREFEVRLTEHIGILTSSLLRNTPPKQSFFSKLFHRNKKADK